MAVKPGISLVCSYELVILKMERVEMSYHGSAKDCMGKNNRRCLLARYRTVLAVPVKKISCVSSA